MKKDDTYYRQLTDLYINNKCSPEEVKELFAWLNKTEADKVLLQKIKVAFDAALDNTFHIEKPLQPLPVTSAKHISMFKKEWFRYAAVACMVVIFFAGYKFISNQASQTKTSTAALVTEIVAGGNQATLTLPTGKVIGLDSLMKGSISLLKNASASNEQGKIDFSKIELDDAINTNLTTSIQTPEGGQYNVVLPDGSHVWLNAASSITFPLQFNGGNRKVSITGEVYFEIAKNTSMPFVVGLPENNEITVTGTHFNVMAYSNENNIKTTLLEGAITFKTASNNFILKPGQQVQVGATVSKLFNNVNTQQVIAWKNGLFDFDEVTLPEIMRQLERWYKIKAVFTNGSHEGHYIGSIKRASSIQDVLKMLELAGEMKFNISGQTVSVINK